MILRKWMAMAMAACIVLGSTGGAIAAEEEITVATDTLIDADSCDTASEEPAPDSTVVDEMLPDDTSTEDMTPDEIPVEDVSADDAPADEIPTDETITDNPVTEDAGSDEETTGDAETENVGTGDTPTDDVIPAETEAVVTGSQDGPEPTVEAEGGFTAGSDQNDNLETLSSDDLIETSEGEGSGQLPAESEQAAEMDPPGSDQNAGTDVSMNQTSDLSEIVVYAYTDEEALSEVIDDTEAYPDGDSENLEYTNDYNYGGNGGSGNDSRASSDFRFIQVEKQPAVTTAGFCGLIREEADEGSRAVGLLSRGGVVYLLAKTADWYFVESGDARGFIRQDDLEVEQEENTTGVLPDEQALPTGKALCTPDENKSFTYTHTTVHEVMAEKREAFLIGKHNIYEYADEHARCIGTGSSGCLVYLLAATGKGWYFIESDDVRGFIRYEDLITGEIADVIADNIPEDAVSTATASVTPEENRSLYFTLMSVRKSTLKENMGLIRFYSPDGMNYTEDQLELIWAIVAQEDNGSYEGALAVITSAVNRSESAVWGYLGSDAFSQLTAPGQYCYSLDDYWRYWLGGNVPDYVKTAVEDCLVRGIRNHPYTSFRSTRGKTTGNDAVQIGGNWYFGS